MQEATHFRQRLSYSSDWNIGYCGNFKISIFIYLFFLNILSIFSYKTECTILVCVTNKGGHFSVGRWAVIPELIAQFLLYWGNPSVGLEASGPAIWQF